MASVRLQEITKSFGRTAVIRGVDLEIADGEFVVFVGASGCGKSTLLRLIAGLDEPSSGDIWIGGDRVTHVPPARRGVSMVFQSYALYPHMTVRENIAFGLRLAKTASETIDERVARVAAMLRIEPLLARRPRELSGGQRQRVAIARSIVREPRVFLFDEPLSNLDAGLRAQTRLEIARMHDDLAATMVYVTHDQVEAMTLADRIVLLNDGRIEQVGPPTELYERPANRYVASFLGSPAMNFVAVAAAGAYMRGADGQAMPSPVPGYAGEATLGVRPEDLRLVDTGDAWSGRTVRVEELGETRIVHVALGDGTLLAVRDRSEPRPRRGTNVRIGIDAARAHLFDAAGKRVVPRA